MAFNTGIVVALYRVLRRSMHRFASSLVYIIRPVGEAWLLACLLASIHTYYRKGTYILSGF
jgi:hypothetical protein